MIPKNGVMGQVRREELETSRLYSPANKLQSSTHFILSRKGTEPPQGTHQVALHT